MKYQASCIMRFPPYNIHVIYILSNLVRSQAPKEEQNNSEGLRSYLFWIRLHKMRLTIHARKTQC